MLGILLIFKCRTLKNFLHELGTQNWKNNSDLVDLGTRDLVKSVAYDDYRFIVNGYVNQCSLTWQ